MSRSLDTAPCCSAAGVAEDIAIGCPRLRPRTDAPREPAFLRLVRLSGGRRGGGFPAAGNWIDRSVCGVARPRCARVVGRFRLERPFLRSLPDRQPEFATRRGIIAPVAKATNAGKNMRCGGKTLPNRGLAAVSWPIGLRPQFAFGPTGNDPVFGGRYQTPRLG